MVSKPLKLMAIQKIGMRSQKTLQKINTMSFATLRSLYSQMVGRGTRLSPQTGKKDLLLLDFLWHSERHELCHPASLICNSDEVAKKMTKKLEDSAGVEMDIQEVEEEALKDVQEEREKALADQLEEMRKRKKKLVDPLQYAMSIQAEDLQN